MGNKVPHKPIGFPRNPRYFGGIILDVALLLLYIDPKGDKQAGYAVFIAFIYHNHCRVPSVRDHQVRHVRSTVPIIYVLERSFYHKGFLSDHLQGLINDDLPGESISFQIVTSQNVDILMPHEYGSQVTPHGDSPTGLPFTRDFGAPSLPPPRQYATKTQGATV